MKRALLSIFLSLSFIIFALFFGSVSVSYAQGTSLCNLSYACTTSLVSGAGKCVSPADGKTLYCCGPNQVNINSVCVTPTIAVCSQGLACQVNPVSGSTKCSRADNSSIQYCCSSGFEIVNGACVAVISNSCTAWNGLAPVAGMDCGATTHDVTFLCGPSNLYTCTCGPLGQCGNHSKLIKVLAPGASNPPVTNPGTPSVGSCDGCSDEGSCAGRKGTFQFSSATYHPECAAQKGYCSGTTYCGGGSTSTAPVAGNLSCGDKCTTSAQCRNPSANGAPVACVNGTCQNTLCAAGQTIPGANCSCGANTRKCGQTCSGALGLCAPGQGTCTYVNTSGPYCPWGWSQTYCAGSSNGYKRTACTTGDAPGGGYLVGPAGKTSGLTVAEISASCQVCGNGSIETGEYCDDGKLNGDATQCTCSKSCQLFSGSLLINGVSTPVSVARGSSVTLTWNTAGMAKCTASNGWTGDKSVKGTETITGVSANTQFDLLCTQASTGRPVTLSANVNITGTTPAPSIDFMINKSNDPVVTTKTVNWATQFAVFNAYFNWNTSGATTCVGYTTPSPQSVYPFPGTVPYVTTASNAGWFLFDKTQPVNLTSTTAALAVINDATAAKYGVFTLTCTGAGGKTSRTILVTTDIPATKPSCGAPVATPTPLPLVCSMIPTVKSTGNVNAWKIGDSITFGVAAASSAGIPTNSKIRYEGQVSAYRGNAQISTINLTPINATASQFMPMKVNAVNATYYYRFRYCVMSITNVETCSAWGAWTAPSGV